MSGGSSSTSVPNSSASCLVSTSLPEFPLWRLALRAVLSPGGTRLATSVVEWKPSTGRLHLVSARRSRILNLSLPLPVSFEFGTSTRKIFHCAFFEDVHDTARQYWPVSQCPVFSW
jgi:hypothetical protein